MIEMAKGVVPIGNVISKVPLLVEIATDAYDIYQKATDIGGVLDKATNFSSTQYANLKGVFIMIIGVCVSIVGRSLAVRSNISSFFTRLHSN
jgi:hypothetical protein